MCAFYVDVYICIMLIAVYMDIFHLKYDFVTELTGVRQYTLCLNISYYNYSIRRKPIFHVSSA